MTLFNKLAAAVITVGMLSTAVVAGEASAADSAQVDTTKAAAPVKKAKKHKKAKKAMADSSAAVKDTSAAK